jgi:hypothetical protein
MNAKQEWMMGASDQDVCPPIRPNLSHGHEEAPAERYRCGPRLLAGLQAEQARTALNGGERWQRPRALGTWCNSTSEATRNFRSPSARGHRRDAERRPGYWQNHHARLHQGDGFEKLGAATGAPPKSLVSMFGPRGNPQARNLFSVIGYLQKRAGVRLHVAG